MTGENGLFVAVVGPSGAGKDTLLDAARQHFADHPSVVFVTRAITRKAEAGGEDHEALGRSEFSFRRERGGFAVHWDAHGLSYGIPVSARAALEAGKLVIANGSRAALPAFAEAFENLVVIEITARPEVIAERLYRRGRESRAELDARIQRAAIGIDPAFRSLQVDNSGTVEEGAQQLIGALERLLASMADR